MVGLVVVSHSRSLAEAACKLALGVDKNDLPIAFAGGAGENHTEFGTDATDIMDAINTVNQGDGVVVLMDLGSAVLSARMAAEMLDGMVDNVRLCPAPLVEGAVAAAVQIGVGADAETICREAAGALQAKMLEFPLDNHDQEQPPGGDHTAPGDATLLRFSMADPNGMHARPAAALVNALSPFSINARIRNADGKSVFVNALSLNEIALAGIHGGDVAELALWGDNTGAAADAVKALVASAYHGQINPPLNTEEQPAEPVLQTLSPGIAIGTVFTMANEPLPEPYSIDNIDEETAKLRAAIESVRAELVRKKDSLPPSRRQEADILDAQALIISDPALLAGMEKTLAEKKQDAASIAAQALAALEQRYRESGDWYMRERAADIAGLSRLAVRAVRGDYQAGPTLDKDIILYTPEISPADFGRWEAGSLVGILTGRGGPTSHAAIIAKTMGIPAITGFVPPASFSTGMRVAMDADTLSVIVNPGEDQLQALRQRRDAWLSDMRDQHEASKDETRTTDGCHIAVEANIGDEASAESAVHNHADGIGLVRTEFLFLHRTTEPDEQEQTEQLAELFKPFASIPVTVRTLDAGGDKELPWLRLPREDNPFLGVRGVRVSMRDKAAFTRQIRAILRGGALAGLRDLRIMTPMITLADEICFARSVVDDAHAQLTAEQVAHIWPVQLGIMVETPAAVFQAEQFAGAVDFFSIGTNDLTQYTMCAERGSAGLESLSDWMHPPVLAAIAIVARAAAKHSTGIAVCGEMAGDALGAQILIGLGIRHLSISPSSIGMIKRMLRTVKCAALAEKANHALTLPDAAAVRALFTA